MLEIIAWLFVTSSIAIGVDGAIKEYRSFKYRQGKLKAAIAYLQQSEESPHE